MINTEFLNDATSLAIFPFLPFFVPLWGWVIATIFVGGCAIAIAGAVMTSGKKLTILGMSRAGKSTLYNMLKTGEPGKPDVTGFEDVSEFKIKDRNIRVKKGKDIGGGNSFLSYYEDLIKENEIIVFVFNVAKYLDSNEFLYQRETKDRLDFIYRKAKEYNKEMKNLVMIASHIDDLPEEKQKHALEEILSSIKGRQYREMFKNNFFVISLVNKEHINKLIDGIF